MNDFQKVSTENELTVMDMEYVTIPVARYAELIRREQEILTLESVISSDVYGVNAKTVLKAILCAREALGSDLHCDLYAGKEGQTPDA